MQVVVEVGDAIDGEHPDVLQHPVDHEHDREPPDESESDEEQPLVAQDRQQASEHQPTPSAESAGHIAGVGIGALLRVCSYPSRPKAKRTRGDLPHPPPHYLAATTIWRLAIDARCRLLVETHLRLQGIEWNLAPCVRRCSADASAEPILWGSERIIWLGWWNGRGRTSTSGSSGAGDCAGLPPDNQSTDACRVCWFGLLSEELMRCIIRELRPIGLRNEYIVFPAS